MTNQESKNQKSSSTCGQRGAAACGCVSTGNAAAVSRACCCGDKCRCGESCACNCARGCNCG